MSKVLVIGAQNIDIFANSDHAYTYQDSNPVKIHIAFGGVGRNIAENLSRLENEVHFLTVFGDDVFSVAAKDSLEKLGINISSSLFLNNQSNSVYLAIMDQKNDLLLGLNDMDITKEMNISFLKTKEEYIREFDFIIIDTNLETEALHYLLITHHDKTIIMEGVSTKKVKKLEEHLDQISILKLNQIELSTLSTEIETEKQLADLHHKGAKTLLITNKDQDIILSKNSILLKKPVLAIERIVNSTGAGDAFLSGYVHGMLHHFTDDQKLDYANRVAHITLKSNNSTSELLNIKEVENYEQIHRI
ncbi:MAG: carbohydrate kinase family protein [Bacteroidales bacterium]|nr:carbohydrate kinase family protein [Bacteroidales bacterium]